MSSGSVQSWRGEEDWGETGSVPDLSLEQLLHHPWWEREEEDVIAEEAALSTEHAAPASFEYQRHFPVSVRIAGTVSVGVQRLAGEGGGVVSCIALGNAHIALGTSLGAVLIASHPEGEVEGVIPAWGEACTSLAFSADSSLIAASYAKGTVRVFSRSSLRPLFSSSTLAQAGRAVLQVEFVKSSSSLVILDSGGSVYEVRMRKGLSSIELRQSRVVFSGCNGEVVRMVVCPAADLLLLVSLTKVLLVWLRKGGAVVGVVPVGGSPVAPPIVQCLPRGPEDVAICVCRDRTLRIFDLVVPTARRPTAPTIPRTTITIPGHSVIVAVDWAGPRLLLLVDAHERLHLVDIKTGHVSTGGEDALVPIAFATAAYKGLATGGNVSPALASLADNAAYGSSVNGGSAVLIASPAAIFELSLIDERQQLEAFYQRSEFTSAALLVLDVAAGRVAPHDPSFLSHVHIRLHECLLRLLHFTLEGLPSGSVDQLNQHYKRCVEVLVHVCMESGLGDFLYDEAFPRLEKDGLCKNALMESLEEVALSGLLSSPPPSLVSELFTFLINEGHLSQLQSVVVTLPIESMDLHQVVTTCRQNGLYDGVIYVMNKALDDFVGPAEEMLKAVGLFSGRPDLLSDQEVELSSRLMLYLHCCLSGTAYPIGKLDNETSRRVSRQTYELLIREEEDSASPLYPHLRTLLQLQPKQFLHMLCTCADCGVLAEESNRLRSLTQLLGRLCLSIPTPSLLSHFLTFICTLLATHRLLEPSHLIQEVVEALLKVEELTEEEEESIVEVLRHSAALDEDKILSSAWNPPRVGVVSSLLCLRRSFSSLSRWLLECSSARSFSALHAILQSELTAEERQSVLACLTEAGESMSLPPALFAPLIVSHHMDYILHLHSSFTADQRATFVARHGRTMEEALLMQQRRGEQKLTGDEEADEWAMQLAVEAACGEGRSDREMEALLLYWLPLGSASDICLNAVAQAGARRCSILLMKARGLTAKALGMLDSQLKEAVESGNTSEMLECLGSVVSLCRGEGVEGEQWVQAVLSVAASVEGEMEEELLSMVLSMGEDGHCSEAVGCLLRMNSFCSSTIEQRGAVLQWMLKLCSHEGRLLDSLHMSQNAENSYNITSVQTLSTSRYCEYSIVPSCQICCSTKSKAAFLHRCGHFEHEECGGDKCAVCTADAPIESSHSYTTIPYTPRNKNSPILREWDQWNFLGPAGILS